NRAARCEAQRGVKPPRSVRQTRAELRNRDTSAKARYNPVHPPGARRYRGVFMPGAAAREDRLFHFVMVKPTHYDDDGYPIQWVRSAIPSNTLACLNGLAQDAQRREVLGPGVEIRLHTYDETNRRVRPERIIRLLRREG